MYQKTAQFSTTARQIFPSPSPSLRGGGKRVGDKREEGKRGEKMGRRGEEGEDRRWGGGVRIWDGEEGEDMGWGGG